MSAVAETLAVALSVTNVAPWALIAAGKLRTPQRTTQATTRSGRRSQTTAAGPAADLTPADPAAGHETRKAVRVRPVAEVFPAADMQGSTWSLPYLSAAGNGRDSSFAGNGGTVTAHGGTVAKPKRRGHPISDETKAKLSVIASRQHRNDLGQFTGMESAS